MLFRPLTSLFIVYLCASTADFPPGHVVEVTDDELLRIQGTGTRDEDKRDLRSAVCWCALPFKEAKRLAMDIMGREYKPCRSVLSLHTLVIPDQTMRDAAHRVMELRRREKPAGARKNGPRKGLAELWATGNADRVRQLLESHVAFVPFLKYLSTHRPDFALTAASLFSDEAVQLRSQFYCDESYPYACRFRLKQILLAGPARHDYDLVAVDNPVHVHLTLGTLASWSSDDLMRVMIGDVALTGIQIVAEKTLRVRELLLEFVRRVGIVGYDLIRKSKPKKFLLDDADFAAAAFASFAPSDGGLLVQTHVVLRSIAAAHRRGEAISTSESEGDASGDAMLPEAQAPVRKRRKT